MHWFVQKFQFLQCHFLPLCCKLAMTWHGKSSRMNFSCPDGEFWLDDRKVLGSCGVLYSETFKTLDSKTLINSNLVDGERGTVPWRSQNIEHHRTPELFSHPAKIHFLDNWNSFSNSCHVMPWLVCSMMEKNDTVKTEIFEKINAMFFFSL